MDDVVVQVVPLHNSSREERVSKLFNFEWVDYEASVIVPYVTVYGVARYKVLACTRVDKPSYLSRLTFSLIPILSLFQIDISPHTCPITVAD